MNRAALVWPVLTLALFPLTATPCSAESQRTISVTGEGSATAPPDMATIHTGVTTEAASAREALDANSKAMEKILAVLKQNHVASKDVQTANFHVTPVHQRESKRTHPEIVAYQVTNQVRVRVRDLPNLGKVLDALVQAGSNQVSGIQFGIDDPTGVLDQARNRAIADARRRAKLYAQASGVRVGRILSISEQPVQRPIPQFMGRAAVAEAMSVPIATGEEEFQVRIYLDFAIEEDE